MGFGELVLAFFVGVLATLVGVLITLWHEARRRHRQVIQRVWRLLTDALRLKPGSDFDYGGKFYFVQFEIEGLLPDLPRRLRPYMTDVLEVTGRAREIVRDDPYILVVKIVDTATHVLRRELRRSGFVAPWYRVQNPAQLDRYLGRLAEIDTQSHGGQPRFPDA